MTPQQAKELLPIIAAYAEGKTIQYNDAPKGSPEVWIDLDSCSFLETIEYRIKPELDPDPYAELKAAKAAGKQIQRRNVSDSGWMKCDHPRWLATPNCYRVAPEPNLAPLCADDVPPGSAVSTCPKDGWHLVTGVDRRGLMCVVYDKETLYVWATLFHDWQILRPGGTWEPCSKEASV